MIDKIKEMKYKYIKIKCTLDSKYNPESTMKYCPVCKNIVMNVAENFILNDLEKDEKIDMNGAEIIIIMKGDEKIVKINPSIVVCEDCRDEFILNIGGKEMCNAMLKMIDKYKDKKKMN